MRNLLFRLLQTLILVAVVAGVARADEEFVHFKKKAAATSGCVLKDSFTDNTTADFFALDTPRQYMSSSFVPTSTYNVCKIEVHVYKAGSYTGNLTMYLRPVTGSTGMPDNATLLDTSTNTVAGTSMLTTPGRYESWNFGGSVTLTGSTRYALILYSSSVSGTAYPYVWRHATTGFHEYKSGDGLLWVSHVNNNSAAIKVYGQ